MFKLEIIYKILGIGAASGLVLHNNSVFLISDNSSFLYEYNILQNSVEKIKLSDNSKEDMPKNQKTDFEAITLNDNKLFIFGSGSTEKREIRYSYSVENNKVEKKDYSKVYKQIRNETSITKDDLNIEGAFCDRKNWYFFQRGNGESAKNGIIIRNRKTKKSNFIDFDLPKIKNVAATFTDAILVDKTIYFLAAVENSDSTYNDGEILGSFIGAINLDNFELIFTKQISTTNKFEGITLLNKNQNNISFLLCEDNDSDEKTTLIYKLTLDF